jgi:hypothetical protein
VRAVSGVRADQVEVVRRLLVILGASGVATRSILRALSSGTYRQLDIGVLIESIYIAGVIRRKDRIRTLLLLLWLLSPDRALRVVTTCLYRQVRYCGAVLHAGKRRGVEILPDRILHTLPGLLQGSPVRRTMVDRYRYGRASMRPAADSVAADRVAHAHACMEQLWGGEGGGGVIGSWRARTYDLQEEMQALVIDVGAIRTRNRAMREANTLVREADRVHTLLLLVRDVAAALPDLWFSEALWRTGLHALGGIQRVSDALDWHMNRAEGSVADMQHAYSTLLRARTPSKALLALFDTVQVAVAQIVNSIDRMPYVLHMDAIARTSRPEAYFTKMRDNLKRYPSSPYQLFPNMLDNGADNCAAEEGADDCEAEEFLRFSGIRTLAGFADSIAAAT